MLNAAYAHHCIRCTHHSEHYVEGGAAANIATAHHHHTTPDELAAVERVRVMPPDCVREMMADWCAAQLSYHKPDNWSVWSVLTPTKGFVLTSGWYERNVDGMVLHADTTRCIIESLSFQRAVRFEPRIIELFQAHKSLAAGNSNNKTVNP